MGSGLRRGGARWRRGDLRPMHHWQLSPGWLATAAGLLAPLLVPPVAAHEIIDGVTGFASLVLHPFAGVETVLVIAALTIVVGASERPTLVLVCVLPVVAGAMLGSVLQREAVLWPGLWRLPLVTAIVLAVFAASPRRAAIPGALGSAFIAAVIVGLGLIPENPGLAGRLEAGAAAAAALVLGLVVVAWPRSLFGHPIARLAGRVVAAWIAAIAAMGLAVTLR